MGGTAEQGKSNKKQYNLIADLRVKQTFFQGTILQTSKQIVILTFINHN